VKKKYIPGKIKPNKYFKLQTRQEEAPYIYIKCLSHLVSSTFLSSGFGNLRAALPVVEAHMWPPLNQSDLNVTLCPTVDLTQDTQYTCNSVIRRVSLGSGRTLPAQ
jgi:hypothetical protein